MTGILGLALLAGVLLWLYRGRVSSHGSVPVGKSRSYEEEEAAEELRRAEEEVQSLDTGAQPEDEKPGDDWGPGTARNY